MWEHALISKTEVVSITSFNEWGEGTQIEPARVPGTLAGIDPGRLATHLDYGEDPLLYLRITREMAERGGVTITQATAGAGATDTGRVTEISSTDMKSEL
jgi:glycoprotein endo-alpha-1,2-mannosidase